MKLFRILKYAVAIIAIITGITGFVLKTNVSPIWCIAAGGFCLSWAMKN